MINLCPNKQVCGSCSWSDISYPDQLEKKLNSINESLSSAGFGAVCENIEPSPKTSHYRNRMDFSIDYRGNIGLKEKGKWWKVIDNHTCFIGDEKIEELFHKCRDWIKTSGFSYCDRKTQKGLLEALVIRHTTTGESMINIVTGPDFVETNEPIIKDKLLELSSFVKSTTLIWSVNHSIADVSFGDEMKIVSGEGFIEEQVNGIKYKITPNSFFQTNSYAARVLQDTVLDFAGISKAKKALDLYCGSGFFTLPLSKMFQEIRGIEIALEAVEIARENARANNLYAEFSCGKTEDYDWENLKPNLVVVDPPRSGLHPNVIKTLLDKKPSRVIYVSCNYQRFSEEMLKFSGSYKLTKVVAVDMFPHTPHVELVSLLTIR